MKLLCGVTKEKDTLTAIRCFYTLKFKLIDVIHSTVNRRDFSAQGEVVIIELRLNWSQAEVDFAAEAAVGKF